jgi:hypothetical protein
MSNIWMITLITFLAVVAIALMIRKNVKDKRRIKPGSQDAVQETMMDQERRKDKI